jgi:hypothetical protein
MCAVGHEKRVWRPWNRFRWGFKSQDGIAGVSLILIKKKDEDYVCQKKLITGGWRNTRG